MQLIRGIHNLRARHRGCVLTIGNFDGVHGGHQTLLQRLKREGERLGVPVMVMVFEPQPLEYFLGKTAPPRLTWLRDKCRHLTQAGVDFLLCVNFNHHFSDNSAQGFVSDLLVEKLGIKLLMIGDDFRFGNQRQGDHALLQRAGVEHGFSIFHADSFCHRGERISSTLIRQALRNDDLALAESYLGRAYSISGRVVRGDAIGRVLGFPTANLLLRRWVAPVSGVYTVEVKGLTAGALPGVANIGTRPTVTGVRQQLEVHLLDTEVDLYGKHIEVVLRTKLRNEQRFESLDQLKQQIAKDVLATRHFFGLNKQV